MKRIVCIWLILSMVLYPGGFLRPEPIEIYTEFTGIGKRIVIPESYGTIEKISFLEGTEPEKLVILIKDAHCNYDAQQNIARILEILVRDYNVNLVGIEGAVGLFDLSRLGNLENENARERTADVLVKRGFLSGPEYLAVTRFGQLGFKLYGIEDTRLYVKNFIMFRNTIRYLEETEFFVEELKRIINLLKEEIYSAKLQELDRKDDSYRENQVPLTDFVVYLSKLANELDVDYKVDYPNVALAVDSIKLEEKIDYKGVEDERSRLISVLQKSVSKEDLKSLVQMSLKYRLGKVSSIEYYDFLQSLAELYNEDLSPYKNLSLYITSLRNQSKIQQNKLFDEIDNLVGVLKEELFTDYLQKELDLISYRRRILDHLLHLTLRRKEFEYFVSRKEEFMPEKLVSFIKIQAPAHNLPISIVFNDEEFMNKVKEVVLNAEEFYNLAIQRDKKLVENTVNIMDKEGKNSMVIVTGGFHADGIINEFKQREIDYVIITPKIVNVQKTVYLSLMMDERIRPTLPAESSLSFPHLLVTNEENMELLDLLGAKEWQKQLFRMALEFYCRELGKLGGVKEEETMPFYINIGEGEEPEVSVVINPNYKDDRLDLEVFRRILEKTIKENFRLREFLRDRENQKRYISLLMIEEYRRSTKGIAREGNLGKATESFIKHYLELCRIYKQKGWLGVQKELKERVGERWREFVPDVVKQYEFMEGIKLPGFIDELKKELSALGEDTDVVIRYLLEVPAYGIDENGKIYKTMFFDTLLDVIADAAGVRKDSELFKKLEQYKFLRFYLGKVFKVDRVEFVEEGEVSDIINDYFKGQSLMAKREIGELHLPGVIEILAQALIGEDFGNELNKEIARIIQRKLKGVKEEVSEVLEDMEERIEQQVSDSTKRELYVESIIEGLIESLGSEDSLELLDGYEKALEDFDKRIPEPAEAPSNAVFYWHADLLISGIKELVPGEKYRIYGIGYGAMDFLNKNKNQQRILYEGERQKEILRKYLGLEDDQFVLEKDFETHVKVESDQGKVVVAMFPHGKEMKVEGVITLVGNKKGADVALMARLAREVAAVGRVDKVGEIKERVKKVLIAYYGGTLGDEEVEELVEEVRLEGGVLIIPLPPISPFMKQYLDVLNTVREIVSIAA